MVRRFARAVAAASTLCLTPAVASAQQFYPMSLYNLTVPSDATESARQVWFDDIASNNSYFVASLGRPPRDGMNSPFYAYQVQFEASPYMVTVSLASAASICANGGNSATGAPEPSKCPLRILTTNLVTGAQRQQEFLGQCLLIPEWDDLAADANGTRVSFDGTNVALSTLLNGRPVASCATKATVMSP